MNAIADEKKLEKSRTLLFVYFTSNIFFCIIPSTVGSLRKAYRWWFTERGLAFKEESYLRLLGKCLYCTWSTHGAQSAYNLLLHQTVTWSTRALNKGNLLLAKSSRRPNVFRAREMSFYFLLSEKFLFFFLRPSNTSRVRRIDFFLEQGVWGTVINAKSSRRKK